MLANQVRPAVSFNALSRTALRKSTLRQGHAVVVCRRAVASVPTCAGNLGVSGSEETKGKRVEFLRQCGGIAAALEAGACSIGLGAVDVSTSPFKNAPP